ncbi:hypothetical protein [Acrocarpospora pleiomorpha]
MLGIDEVHPDDDLFDLDGHSPTITQIIARVDPRPVSRQGKHCLMRR